MIELIDASDGLFVAADPDPDDDWDDGDGWLNTGGRIIAWGELYKETGIFIRKKKHFQIAKINLIELFLILKL